MRADCDLCIEFGGKVRRCKFGSPQHAYRVSTWDWLRSLTGRMRLKKSRTESKGTLRRRGWQEQDPAKETEVESLCVRSQVKKVSCERESTRLRQTPWAGYVK